MRTFITKLVVLSLAVMGTVLGINCIVDPANLLHDSVTLELVSELNKGNTVISPGDFDEELFNETMIKSLSHTPETIIIGSSHIMYADWETKYDDYLIMGLSGANLGDYYSLVGMMDSYDKLPERIVIGVDSWAFLEDSAHGRHKGLSDYASSLRSELKISDDSQKATFKYADKLKEAKELISFPYFQSSVKKIIASPSAAFRLNHKGITVTDDSISDSYDKITPTCKRILSKDSYESLEKINMSADYQISIGSVYSMGLGCEKTDEDNFREFTDLLEYLQKQDIEVMLYLPAWYPSLYDYFTTDSNYQFVLKLEEDIRKYGKETDIPVYGSYSPYNCDLKTDDYADCLHIKPDKVMSTFLGNAF